MKGTMAMAGTLIIIWLSPVWGQSREPQLKPSPTPKIIWTDGIGSGFHKGMFSQNPRDDGMNTNDFSTENS
jgi:hypothetical protein